jgi:hypothetical protein
MQTTRFYSKDGVFAALAGVMFVTTAAGAVYGSTSPQQLLSSVMWQVTENVDEKFIYPPGVPAVLRPFAAPKTLRIEQYYAKPVNSVNLAMSLHGTWPETPENDPVRAANGSLAGRYVSVTAPLCEQTPTELKLAPAEGAQPVAEKAYRCSMDATISPDTPTGTIGLSVSIDIAGRKFEHQNGVFWIILPEMKASHYPRPRLTSSLGPLGHLASQNCLPESGSLPPPLASSTANRVTRSTVQITSEGNYSLGSGFFVANPEIVFPIFGPEMVAKLKAMPSSTKYIVTAAHLFPVSYGFNRRGRIQNFLDHTDLLFDDGETYDIAVAGKPQPKAARLLLTNMEADIALLALTPEAEERMLNELGFYESDLLGLTIGKSMPDASDLDVFGFPVSTSGEITHRRGYLKMDAWPTDDTSNFGPVRKFKLCAIDNTINLAEPGLSGGPIVNRMGEVIGLSVERPNDTNSLIALDLTSLPDIPGDWLAPGSKCKVTFNPFDRVLRLIKGDDSCSYGRFGSGNRDLLQPLEGEWSFQEVLGLADDDTDSATPQASAYSLINGHAIIKGGHIIIAGGHIIINGHPVFNAFNLVVDRARIDQINNTEMTGGFKLNPDSFQPPVMKGIRVLKSGKAADDSKGKLGELVVAGRKTIVETQYKPFYSIREFAIWWHGVANSPSADTLLCVSGSDCVDHVKNDR